MPKYTQRGFVGAGIMDLAFLLVLILAGYGIYRWLSTIVAGQFAVAVTLTWLMAFGACWYYSEDHKRVARFPAGFLVFLASALVLAPASWFTDSKIAVAVAALICVLAAKFFGHRWSKRLEARLAAGATPWYLDQSIDIFDDLFRWALMCVIAFFVLCVLPLVFVIAVPPTAVVWVAMVWSFVASSWYFYVQRKSRVRFLKIPVGSWVQLVVTVVLWIFRKRIVGELEPGSVAEISYLAYAPVVTALFVEIVLVGTKSVKPAKPAQPAGEIDKA